MSSHVSNFSTTYGDINDDVIKAAFKFIRGLPLKHIFVQLPEPPSHTHPFSPEYFQFYMDSRQTLMRSLLSGYTCTSKRPKLIAKLMSLNTWKKRGGHIEENQFRMKMWRKSSSKNFITTISNIQKMMRVTIVNMTWVFIQQHHSIYCQFPLLWDLPQRS